jgi:hypothetical protein
MNVGKTLAKFLAHKGTRGLIHLAEAEATIRAEQWKREFGRTSRFVPGVTSIVHGSLSISGRRHERKLNSSPFWTIVPANAIGLRALGVQKSIALLRTKTF